jgi:NAD(P)H-nitrite reductase large subunit
MRPEKRPVPPIPAGLLPQDAGEAFILVPRLPSGIISAEQLENLARAIRKFSIPMAKLTPGQRIALAGIRPGDVEAVRAELGLREPAAWSHAAPYAHACPGATACANGLRDTLTMATRLEELFNGLELPGKVKAGLSGCPRCCGESYLRDIGLVGRKNGWTVIFGGNAGAKPRVGDELASGLDDDAALDLVARALAHYAAQAKPRQRTARWLEDCDIASVRAALGLTPAG